MEIGKTEESDEVVEIVLIMHQKLNQNWYGEEHYEHCLDELFQGYCEISAFQK